MGSVFRPNRPVGRSNHPLTDADADAVYTEANPNGVDTETVRVLTCQLAGKLGGNHGLVGLNTPVVFRTPSQPAEWSVLFKPGKVRKFGPVYWALGGRTRPHT